MTADPPTAGAGGTAPREPVWHARPAGQGLLVVVSGPSGVGKGTVVRRVVERLPRAELSVSVTTRPARAGESEGRSYHFVDDEDFDRLVADGALLEWARVHKARYGTPRDWVEERLAEGIHVLLEIDVQGALQVRERKPGAFLVFLTPPSWRELVRRLHERGTESEEEQALRLSTAADELAAAPAFDHVVVNDELEQCIEEVVGLIRHTTQR